MDLVAAFTTAVKVIEIAVVSGLLLLAALLVANYATPQAAEDVK